jgi:hypothetical protein
LENLLVLPFCKLAWPVSAKSLTRGELGSKLLCNGEVFTNGVTGARRRKKVGTGKCWPRQRRRLSGEGVTELGRIESVNVR